MTKVVGVLCGLLMGLVHAQSNEKGIKTSKIGYDLVDPGISMGMSSVMARAEDARRYPGKALGKEMQILFDSLKTPFEISLGKSTATYAECVGWYKKLAARFPAYCKMMPIGYGDIGKEIYVFKLLGEKLGRMDRFGKGDEGMPANVLSAGEFSKTVKILINNNIHPGEPEGTDASMLLLRDMLFFAQYWQQTLPYLELHVVCQYNVDGTLNRNTTSRANQNGPDAYGFRGNAQNLDLNRDFIKMDSRNAKALVSLMVAEQYHLFVDNHTSNGADYQYVLTYFHTCPEKLHPALRDVLDQFESGLLLRLKQNNWPTAPYVTTMETVPDSGLFAFWESGRYATGFAALHHTIGYTVETHMLKPFNQRMLGTLAFLEQFVANASDTELHGIFEKSRKQGIFFQSKSKPSNPLLTDQEVGPGSIMAIDFTLDKSRYEMIPFLGYSHAYKPSDVTGAPRLYYDRSKPWSKEVRYYSHYKSTDSVRLPQAYIVPFAYREVIDRLNMNGIRLRPIPFDTILSLRISYIQDFKTVSQPYEKHYMHYAVKTRDTVRRMQLHRGDYIVAVTSQNAHFLSAVLEPRAPDSYFAWNFFDGILMQKEGYSDYVFEDLASTWLLAYPNQKAELDRKKATDPVFAKDPDAQLNWVYKQTEHYEYSHNLYPIYYLD